MRYCIQIKKTSTSRFFGEKIFEKKLGPSTTMLRKYHRLHTYIHTYELFLKTGFLAFWGLKTYLYAKKLKIKISSIAMVPL